VTQPAQITAQSFESKFKSWNEATSTSPSGIHLGHYKALFSQNDTNPSTDKGNVFEAQRQAIIQAHVQLLNYALNKSYSFNRLKNVVNVMIEKSPAIQRFTNFKLFTCMKQSTTSFSKTSGEI
jgi:hypothetical protein